MTWWILYLLTGIGGYVLWRTYWRQVNVRYTNLLRIMGLIFILFGPMFLVVLTICVSPNLLSYISPDVYKRFTEFSIKDWLNEEAKW